MVRWTALAALLLVMPSGIFAQATGVLHIKIVLLDPEGKPTPVPGHALLISDNPATAAPRLVRTAVDGTADVKLRPGNYTIESDRPVAFRGKAYQWTQTLDVVAGKDTVLNLTTANAEATTASPTGNSGDRPLEADPAFLLPRWQDSVVELWTPTTHASGFVVDSSGLVATSQKAIGSATSAEVQLTPGVKVTARVLLADSAKDVAVLWIDPQATASVKPIPLGCGPQIPALADTQEVFTIGIPLGQVKDMTSGTASGLSVPTSGAGGPVFVAQGAFVGITSPASGNNVNDERRGRSRVVRATDVCEVVAAAAKKTAGATPLSGVHLPIEPVWTLPEAAFKDAAEHRAGSLNPYASATQGFDLSFITPVMIFGARYQAELLGRRSAGKAGGTGSVQPIMVRRLFDFANWTDYVENLPSVLLVRVSPKMVEGFWQSVARGAAYTQGAAIPAFKHPKSGFARLRAWCGDNEVTPIHPFTIETRIGEKDTIAEGLYVFDPNAFSPECGAVKFVVYSDKEPEKGEMVVVEPRVVQQISQDFALYK